MHGWHQERRTRKRQRTRRLSGGLGMPARVPRTAESSMTDRFSANALSNACVCVFPIIICGSLVVTSRSAKCVRPAAERSLSWTSGKGGGGDGRVRAASARQSRKNWLDAGWGPWASLIARTRCAGCVRRPQVSVAAQLLHRLWETSATARSALPSSIN